MLIERERQTYEDMWAIQAYATNSPGEIFAPVFFDMVDSYLWRKVHTHPFYFLPQDYSVLDAGCGAGAGALALLKQGFSNIKLADITDAGLSTEVRFEFPFYKVCLWDNLTNKFGYIAGQKIDFIYCCDVMEHIPTPLTMLVASRLLDITRHTAFFSISLMPDNFGAWIGKTLHHTLLNFNQWKDLLNTVGKVVEARDFMSNGLYLVEPK